jgi:hypothetical protein
VQQAYAGRGNIPGKTRELSPLVVGKRDLDRREEWLPLLSSPFVETISRFMEQEVDRLLQPVIVRIRIPPITGSHSVFGFRLRRQLPSRSLLEQLCRNSEAASISFLLQE